jgi:FtsP/CotA-like multicopper oxidase with cupredoxin domain
MPSRTDAFTRTGEPAQMMVVGSDAGLLAEPVVLSTVNYPLRIGVAERYGVVIDFAQFRPEVTQVYSSTRTR